jgi:Ca-activated chloride channel family protein
LRKPVVTTFFLAFMALATGAGDTPSVTGSESAARAVAEGRAAYALGRWDQALVAFETAIKLAPTSAVARYNAGAALFQLGRYDLARERYREARERAGSFLRTKIDFALGNTALAEGDIPGAIRSYDDCVLSTARGADLETVRRDAAINRRFALEQQQALAARHDDNPSDQPRSPNSQRRNRPDRQGKGDDQSPDGQPESDAGSGGSSREAEGDRDRQPARRKRRGGAGGGQSVPPGARGDSPDDRLDAALENIRAAQNRRLPDDEPPASANDDRKDW